MTDTSNGSPSIAALATGTRAGRLRALSPTARWVAGLILLATIASLVMYHRVWADPTGRTAGAAGRIGDPLQSMWFLKWIPWRLVHGHNPFPVTAFDYPGGVNLSWNTSTPTLALFAAPITALFGPVLAYNVLLTLCPVLTTATGFLWLRRHVGRAEAAAVGALVIGFGPFMAGHARGHLHMAFLALVPLILMLAEDLLWRKPRPASRTAVYLGLVTAAQLGISEEVLVIAALGVAIVMLAYLVVDARAVGRALQEAAAPLAIAVVVALALASPLLVEQFVRTGGIHMDNNYWHARVPDYLSATGNQLLPGLTFGRHTIGRAEQGAFVGCVLLAVLVVGVIVDRRRKATRATAIALVVLVLLTFGDTNWLGVQLPWHFIGKLPGLAAVLPLRLALASWLVITFLLAVWVDALIPRLRAGRRSQSIAARTGLAAVAAAVVTLAPAAQPASPVPHTPSFFTASRTEVPAGAAIVVLPPATPRDASAMYWQERAGFRFRMLGGYAYHDGGDLWPVQTKLMRVAEGRTSAPAEVSDARAELARDRYRAIVVVIDRADTPQSMSIAQLLTGRPPDRITDGVALWLL